MHDPLCTACLQLRVWTSLAGAAVFRSGSACSTWLRLLLPGLAAGRTAGAAAVPHGLLGVLQQLLSHCQCLCCHPTSLKHFVLELLLLVCLSMRLYANSCCSGDTITIPIDGDLVEGPQASGSLPWAPLNAICQACCS